MDGSVVFAKYRQCAPPFNAWFPEPTPPSIPKCYSIGINSRFCTAHNIESLCCTMGRHSPPQNCPFVWAELDPCRIYGSWGPPECPHPKRNLDRFSHFCRAHDRNRPTDHATPSVAICRICVLRSGQKSPPHTDGSIVFARWRQCVPHRSVVHPSWHPHRTGAAPW